MAESKKNLVENIKGIKKGSMWGLSIPGFSGNTNSNLSGLLEAISKKEELESMPDFVGEYIQPKELEILLKKNITASGNITKNALSFLPEDFLTKIKKDIFLEISDECLQLVTPEQWNFLPKETFMKLAKSNRLQYLSNESLEVVSKNLDLYHKYNANITSDRLTEDQLKTQLNSLIEAKKIQYLAKEAIGTITDGIIDDLGEKFIGQLSAKTIDYLATVNGDGTILVNKKLCALNMNFLPIEEFKELKPETIVVLTSKQISELDEKHLLVLKQNPILLNAVGDKFSDIRDIDGIDINSLNETALGNITSKQLKQFGLEQFKSLCDKDKSKFLNSTIIEQIPDDYLLYLAGHGLTKEQAMYINKKQFELVKNSISPEVISNINADIVATDQEFLKNLSIEQAEKLNEMQVTAIQKNNMFNLIPNNILSIITSKIKKERLAELDEDTLMRIVRNKNEDIPVLDSEPKLTNFDVTIKSEEIGNFNEDNIRATIDARIENEDWSKLRDDCFYWVKDDEQKLIVYNMLNKKIDSRATTVYGITDKIQLLLTTIPLSPNAQQLNSNYNKLEETIVSLINEPSYTVEEYLTKSDLFSSLANNGNLDIELREMICKEQIKLMEEDFVNKFYTKSGRNSLHNSIKEEISKAYLNYANLLVEKYKEPELTVSKFEKALSPDEERNLTPQERKYRDCILNIHNYTPDLESKIRFWTATGTRLVSKAAATYFAAKAAANSNSKVVSAVAGVGTAAIGVSAISDASDVVEQFFTLNDRKGTHKKERKGEIGIFKRIKRFFGRIKNKFIKKNILIVNNLQETTEKRAELYRKEAINEQKQKELANLKEKIKTKEESMIVLLKGKEEKSKQTQLIEDDIEMRTEALKAIAQRRAMALKEKYPEFKEKEGISGIFSKLGNISKSILNGVISGVLDTASLGYGGNIYNQLVNEKSDEEKVNIERRLMTFQKEASEIDKWLVEELNNLRHEKCRRLALTNKDDKQQLLEFEKNIGLEQQEIGQRMEIFKPEKSIKLDKDSCLISLQNEGELDKEKIDVITEDLETLINSNKVDEKIKMNNIKNVNEFFQKSFDSGNLVLTDPQVSQSIAKTLVVMNEFIQTQLKITANAIAAAAELENTKRQSLEKEQNRINDMQIKVRENGVDIPFSSTII